MEKIQWKVEGMDCSNCALTIRRYLEKKGMQEVKVNFATGDVSFDANGNFKAGELATGIKDLGYEVATAASQISHAKKPFLATHLQRFWVCLPFTLVLMLHMIPGIHPDNYRDSHIP